MDTKYLSDIQPQLFPRLHYFSRMLNSHEFVFRDDVQFVRNHRYPDGQRQSSYQIHSPVFSSNGVLLLNAQIKKKSGQSIRDQQLSYEPDWTRKLVNKLDESYRKAAHYQSIRNELISLLGCQYSSLAELNIRSTMWGLCRLLGIDYDHSLSMKSMCSTVASNSSCRLKNIELGSDLLGGQTGNAGTATDRILLLCRVSHCDAYIAGGTAIDSYFEMEKFVAGKVRVCRQQWQCDKYTQGSISDKFIANLSIVDLLANIESSKALVLLTSNFELVPAELAA